MKRILACVLGAVCIAWSSSSVGQTLYQQTGTLNLGAVGINNTSGTATYQRAYFTLTSPALIAPCSFGTVSFDMATPVGRAIYSQVIIAKIAGKPLSRIDYSYAGAPTHICTLVFVEVTA